MANPKYADLPGIAHDQPDIYETTDLPEAEQGGLSMADIIKDQCDSVETLTISPNDAHAKFKGKTLDAANVDFTDAIGIRKKIGYDVRSGDWEMVGDNSKEKETPLQTYNRLQFEIKKLFEDVNAMKESSDKGSEIPPAVLFKQVEDLQKELIEIQMEKVLGSEAIAEMSDPLGSLHKKLVMQLESFKTSPAAAPGKARTGSSTSASADDSVKYELYVRPDQTKLEHASKVASLEQRLKNLESVIGQDKIKWSCLTSNTDGKSITAAIKLLSSKLNLLEPMYLDQVENRLVVLHQCMQQLAEKKHQIEDADKRNKVAELYDLVKRVHELDECLPQVVQRLVSLKELHEQTLQFSKSLTQLDASQQQITNSLKMNETLLKEVQESFSKNSEMIQKNIESLTSRMAALK